VSAERDEAQPEAGTAARQERLQALLERARELAAQPSGALAELLVQAEAGGDMGSVAEALFALQVATSQAGHRHSAVKPAGPARKVSVSLPEELTAAVQRRVGPGKFSQYVTEAVTRQLEQDLLAELSGLLTSEHGPVPEEYLAEARATWPDSE
jgi:Arc/MetJ-type ribon-helix-helix transcriptional regulator